MMNERRNRVLAWTAAIGLAVVFTPGGVSQGTGTLDRPNRRPRKHRRVMRMHGSTLTWRV
jgi:hypothetical protein